MFQGKKLISIKVSTNDTKDDRWLHMSMIGIALTR